MIRQAVLTKPAPEKPMADLSHPIVFRFSASIDDFAADWDAAAPIDNLFLQRAYLNILEKNPPLEMQFGYLVFYKNDSPVGVACCQIKHFSAASNIRNDSDEKLSDICFFDALLKWMRRRFADMVEADILICGNMLLTGEHAFYFDFSKISEKEALAALESGIQALIAAHERSGSKIPAVLHKELFDEHRHIGKNHWSPNGYVEFEIQPNMILDIKWPSFDAYVAAMTKKYRARTKRAFTKKDTIVVKELSAEDIENNLGRIYSLYKEIAKNAGFNMVDLNERYLLGLKKGLPDLFHCYGYYLKDSLVAFFTVIDNHRELEAHFLGYEQSLNHDHQIYHNILYDIVQIGIARGFQKIIFARTALEIKSSVGAVAHPMHCYLRHQNSFANIFTERALDYLKPVEIWEPRHPFSHDDH